jgi:hypothetical protein
MVTFPELRALMAKYGMNQEKMGELTGNTYITFGKKLNKHSEFTYNEMIETKKFFESKGEVISIDTLFFDWIFTKVK